MRVGVDGDECALFEGVADPTPVHVEAAGVGVEFDRDVVSDAGVDDGFVIDGVAGAAEEEAAGHVAEDGGVGVFDGFEEAGHGFFDVHLQVGVDGGDDEVEGGEDLIAVVEGSIVEDVGFDAFEDGEGGEFFVELVYLGVLFADTVFFEAVGVEGAFAVVADDEVFEAFVDAGGGHFFEGVGTVAPGAVAVDDGFYVGGLDDGGKGAAAALFIMSACSRRKGGI